MNNANLSRTEPDVQAIPFDRSSPQADRDAIDWARRLADSTIDPFFHDGLILYLARRVPPGSFLMALLSNHIIVALRAAQSHWDERARLNIVPIYEFIMLHAPVEAYGSEDAVSEWLEGRVS